MPSSNRFAALSDCCDMPDASLSISTPVAPQTHVTPLSLLSPLSPRTLSWADEKQEEIDAEEAARASVNDGDEIEQHIVAKPENPSRTNVEDVDYITEEAGFDTASCCSIAYTEEVVDGSVVDGDADTAADDGEEREVFDTTSCCSAVDAEDIDMDSVVGGDTETAVDDTNHGSPPFPDSWDEYIDSISGGFESLRSTATTQAPSSTPSYAKIVSSLYAQPKNKDLAKSGLPTSLEIVELEEEMKSTTPPQVQSSDSFQNSPETSVKSKKKSGAQRRKEIKAQKTAAERSVDATTEPSSADTVDLNQALPVFDTILQSTVMASEPDVKSDDATEMQTEKLLEADGVTKCFEPTPPSTPEVAVASITAEADLFKTSADCSVETTTQATSDDAQSCITDLSNKTAESLSTWTAENDSQGTFVSVENIQSTATDEVAASLSKTDGLPAYFQSANTAAALELQQSPPTIREISVTANVIDVSTVASSDEDKMHSDSLEPMMVHRKTRTKAERQVAKQRATGPDYSLTTPVREKKFKLSGAQRRKAIKAATTYRTPRAIFTLAISFRLVGIVGVRISGHNVPWFTSLAVFVVMVAAIAGSLYCLI